MSEPTNEDRASWAKIGLDAFADETGLMPEDDGYQMVIGDLLADIMHFCKQNDIPFDACLQTGEMHYEEELAEETMEPEEEEA